MNDYLFIGQLIAERIKEALPTYSVEFSMRWPNNQEADITTPAVIVTLEEDIPGTYAGSSPDQNVDQTWVCIVVVKDNDTAIGTIVSNVIKALSGWRPSVAGVRPLKRIKSNFNPENSKGGFYYFPISLTASFVFTER